MDTIPAKTSILSEGSLVYVAKKTYSMIISQSMNICISNARLK